MNDTQPPANLEQNILNKVEQKITAAITANNTALLNDIGTKVTAAINAERKVESVNIELKEKSGLSWIKEIFQVLTPAVAAILVGFIAYNAGLTQTEKTVQSSQEQSKLISQLSLKTEFVRKKLDTYDKINQILFTLVDSGSVLKVNKQNEEHREKFNSSIKNLYEILNIQSVYIPEDTLKQLNQVWIDSNALMQGGDPYDKVKTSIEASQKLIREEIIRLTESYIVDTSNKSNSGNAVANNTIANSNSNCPCPTR